MELQDAAAHGTVVQSYNVLLIRRELVRKREAHCPEGRTP